MAFFWKRQQESSPLEKHPHPENRGEKVSSHSNELIDSVLDVMAEGLMVVDRDQSILLCNPAVEGLLNRPPREAKGLHLWEVLRHREVGDMVALALSERQEQTKEITLPLPEDVFLRVRARPFPAEGEPRGVVITFNDYTHVRRLETVRRDFVANVSHELRTPLTALRAALETLLEGALEDPKYAREFLETAENQVERLQRLIDDLLTLSRLDKPAGSTDSSVSSDLSATVDKIIKVLVPMAKRENVSLEAKWPEEPIHVKFSMDELTQVFMNLLDNGIKFNRPNGRVSVSVNKKADFAEVSVTDTGMGIPADDLPRIFERFYRVDKARSRELGGTGLGLAIIKHIVENRGGSIRAASTPGQGSEFTVTLPLVSR